MINFETYNLEKEIEKIKNTAYSCDNYLDWYSSTKILEEIYDLKHTDKLKARIYHGIFATDYEWNYSKAIDCKYPVLCTRQSQVDFLINSNRKGQTLATGALFPLYKNSKKIKPAENAKGTIVFPVHPAAYISTTVNWENYIQQLKDLPEEFKPINICLHWRDILNNLHEIFLENGFNVYCSGHCNDVDFVDNFYEILRHHKYATSNNEMSSALLYAIDFGLPTFVYGKEDNMPLDFSQNKMCGHTEEEMNEYYRINTEFFNRVIPKYPNMNVTDENKAEINRILGFTSEINKNKIKNILQKEITKREIASLTDNFVKIEKIKPKDDSEKYLQKKITVLKLIKFSFKSRIKQNDK